MYQVSVQKDFIAKHRLVGGDWGKENDVHPHHYILELVLRGKELDRHGYLVDIDDIDKNLVRIVNHFQDKLINELPEFSGLNPSIEHFARIICKDLAQTIQAKNINHYFVRLWENSNAWASFEVEK